MSVAMKQSPKPTAWDQIPTASIAPLWMVEVDAMTAKEVIAARAELLAKAASKKRRAKCTAVFVLLLRALLIAQGLQALVSGVNFLTDDSKHCDVPLPQLQIANGGISIALNLTAAIGSCFHHYAADSDSNRLCVRVLQWLEKSLIPCILIVIMVSGVYAWGPNECDSGLVDSATASATIILIIIFIAVMARLCFRKYFAKREIASKEKKDREARILQRGEQALREQVMLQPV